MDEKKPKVEAEAEAEAEARISGSAKRHVTVRVEMDGQQEVDMRIRMDSKLAKLVQTYCTHKGLQKEFLRFTYDGDRLKEFLTPNDLNFEDGDVINVFSEQDGGAGRL